MNVLISKAEIISSLKLIKILTDIQKRSYHPKLENQLKVAVLKNSTLLEKTA